jgi:type IV pilus assembly protein PilE
MQSSGSFSVLKPTEAAGFTAIELLVTALVIAILVAIAVPGYGHYQLRRQRAEATRGLLAIQAQEERFLLKNGFYSGSVDGAAPRGLGLPRVSEQGHYEFQLAAGPAGSSYLARALPRRRGGQNPDGRCAVFSLDQNGRNQAQDATGADRTAECWH